MRDAGMPRAISASISASTIACDDAQARLVLARDAPTWPPPADVQCRMSYHARIDMPPLIVTGITGAFGNTKRIDERIARRRPQVELGHERHEVVRVGAEAVHPDDGGVGRLVGRAGLAFDGLHAVIGVGSVV